MYDFAHHLRNAIDTARAHGLSDREIERALHAAERDVRERRADASTGEDDTPIGTE